MYHDLDNCYSLTFISSGKALTVDSVDLCKEKNQELHHTDQYEQDDLVLRRGQEFTFTLKFDRNVKKESDLVTAKFAYGKDVGSTFVVIFKGQTCHCFHH